mgnify:CR=1 FL=1
MWKAIVDLESLNKINNHIETKYDVDLGIHPELIEGVNEGLINKIEEEIKWEIRN